MAKPRVFVSSTCYDLGVIRSELRPFIEAMGYEPVMSDYADILYNPDEHSHLSCVKQISDCDLVILIVGSRFGGKAVESVIANIDVEKIMPLSADINKIEQLNKNMSITQAEVVTAIANNIPLYPFIDQKVYHEQYIYEKNKHDEDVIKKIHFPSIEKQETAHYIFNFISFIRGLSHNNSIYEFATIADIKMQLTKQWAAYFKELLHKRHHYMKTKDMEELLSRRFDTLQETIISSIDDGDKRDKIRQITTYRLLISFVAQMSDFSQMPSLLLTATSWENLRQLLGIIAIKEVSLKSKDRAKAILLREKDHYRCHYSIRYVDRIQTDWDSFFALSKKNKKEIISLFSADEIDQSLPFEYIDKPFE